MTDNLEYIFLRNPEKFKEAVFTDEENIRFSILENNIKDIILCEIIRYGIFSKSVMIAPLQKLYNEVALTHLTESERWNLFKHLTNFIQNVEVSSVNAYLPFIAEEPNKHIVATAVIDYVSLGPLTNKDPMSRVKDIISFIEGGNIRNTGAAFGGLLFLGDARVCKLLWQIKDILDETEVDEAVKCSTEFLHSASIEFLIDWLEGMEGNYYDRLFGIVASGLVLLKNKSSFDYVNSNLREFPISKSISPQKQNANRSKLIPVNEYLKKIAQRLYALEETEPPPRIMPLVLSAWGLQPKSSASETALNDDRFASPIPKAGVDLTTIPDGMIFKSNDEWFDGSGILFMVWGLLNPNGPTLYCLGEKRVNGKRRIFFRWLHMLGGATYYSAFSYPENITYQSIYDFFNELNTHLQIQKEPTIFDNIPSFVIVNKHDETIIDIVKNHFMNSQCADKNWSRELAYQNEFYDDFFSRAGCELREAYNNQLLSSVVDKNQKEFLDLFYARYSHIPAFTNAKIPTYDNFGLSNEIFDLWWSKISNQQFQRSCLQQLSEMWKGAISLIAHDETSEHISFDKVINFLIKFQFEIK